MEIYEILINLFFVSIPRSAYATTPSLFCLCHVRRASFYSNGGCTQVKALLLSAVLITLLLWPSLSLWRALEFSHLIKETSLGLHFPFLHMAEGHFPTICHGRPTEMPFSFATST